MKIGDRVKYIGDTRYGLDGLEGQEGVIVNIQADTLAEIIFYCSNSNETYTVYLKNLEPITFVIQNDITEMIDYFLGE